MHRLFRPLRRNQFLRHFLHFLRVLVRRFHRGEDVAQVAVDVAARDGGGLHVGGHLAGHGALFLDGAGDAGDAVANGADGGFDLREGGDDIAGHALHIGDFQRNFVRGLSDLRGEVFDLAGDDGKTFAGFTGAGGFDGGVEGEQVDLVGDALNDSDDAAHLLRGEGKFLRGAVRLFSHHHGVLHGFARMGHRGGDFLNGAVEFFRCRRDGLHGGGGLCGGAGGGGGADVGIVHGLGDTAEVFIDHLADAVFFLTAQDVIGDVGRVFHDLEGIAVRIENGIIGSLNPDFLATLADALKFRRLEFSLTEGIPEMFVIMAGRVMAIDKKTVMTSFDFSEGVAERGEEILVRPLHGAIKVEMDHRLRFADGVDLALEVGILHRLARDVGGVFHHLVGFALAVENRVVGGLYPDFTPPFAKAFVFARLKHAVAQVFPKGAVFFTRRIGVFDEQAVMSALNFRQGVAHSGEKIVVCPLYCAIQIEVDHSL